MKTFHPYSQIVPNVQSLLANEDFARVTIEAWLQSERSEIQNPLKNQFGAFRGRFLARPGVVQLWTGLAQPNLYSKTIRWRQQFLDWGLQEYYSEDERTKAATSLNMNSYVRMSSTLRLYSPRCVVFLLLTTRSEQGQSFRRFINDRSATQSYSAPKLIKTIKGELNGTGNSPREQPQNSRIVNRASAETRLPGFEVSPTPSLRRVRRGNAILDQKRGE
jgi:hypothetical protein